MFTINKIKKQADGVVGKFDHWNLVKELWAVIQSYSRLMWRRNEKAG
jgi:hypothetical protein